jgi:uncharacterized protein YkwD
MFESFTVWLKSVLTTILVMQMQLIAPTPAPSTPLTESDQSVFTAPSPSIKPMVTNKPSASKPPKLAGSVKTKSPDNNYQLEPDPSGHEGFYIIKNAPSEKMALVDEINQAVNQYRQNHHLNSLYIDKDLCEIASTRAEEVDKNFSHDELGKHIENGDYNKTGFSVMGENIWQGSFSGVHIVEYGWDKSPGHQANLKGDWTRGCAGVYKTSVSFIFVR